MAPRRMRIALVSSSYHPHFGGVEEHVRHVAKGLQKRGQEVEVWTVDRGDGLKDEMVDGCRVRYLPTPLPARSGRALGSLALRAPGTLARWLRAYAQFRPDVLNVQCFGPNGLYGLALATLTRTPLVVTSHGETFGDEHSVFDRSALLRNGLRRATAVSIVTAVSSVVAEDLRSRFGAKEVHIIPNGVRVLRADGPVSPSSKTPEPVLICVGRLVPQKGFDLLLKAAARSQHGPRVWIVGDGAERSNLEQLASDLGMADRVDFLGRRSPEEVQDLMARATAVVVPSRAEAFGIVVLEAWASGTPLLATSRGGPGDLITPDHDGLLIDPEDREAVSGAIDRILADGALAQRLASHGRKSVRSYTWDRVVDHYCRLYDQLMVHE